MINVNVQTVGIDPKSSRDEYWPLLVGSTSLGYDLDPAYAWDSASFDIINQVWEGLFAYDSYSEEMDIIPRLADALGTWNSAGDEFNVSLRSGVTFHNGQEFNASSVKYTFDRLWELCVYYNSQIRELYFPFGFDTPEMNATVGYGYLINETMIIDNTHISFKLNFPYVPFESLLCFSGSFIVDSSTTEINTYINFDDIALGRAIGTGPYKITEFIVDTYISFEAYDFYYRGVPTIKNVRFLKFYSSEDISNALLDDIIDFPTSIDVDYIDNFYENLMTVVEDPMEQYLITYLGMNNDLLGKDYRQAINFAIDHVYINYEINENIKTSMTSIIPTHMLYHKDCDVPMLDIWLARQILINAGLSGPLDEFSTDQEWIDLANSGSPLLMLGYQYNIGNLYREEIGALLIENLRHIGIHVYLEPLTWAEFLIKLYDYPEELNLFSAGWLADFNDPSNFINPIFSNTSRQNVAQVNDPWLQDMMNAGLIETDEIVREQIYYAIQDYIATDLMPFVFLGYGIETGVHTAHLENFQYDAMGRLSFFECSWADDYTDSDSDGITDFDENYQYGTDPYYWDTDYDDIGDWEEIYNHYTDPTEWDTDFDGLGDWEEIYDFGTDPTKWDTDDDGLGDGDEFSFNTDPFNPDCDGDGLTDGQEVLQYHTDPNLWDTDNDGFSDKDEVDAGSDPNDYESTPENVNPNPDPFANIPGFPIASFLSIFIFISIGLVFFTKKKFKN